MRYKLAFFLLLISSVSLAVNSETEDDTLSFNGFVKVFYNNSLASTNINYFGASAAIVFYERFYFGGFGMRKVGEMIADRGLYSGKKMNIGMGGITIGYSPFPTKLIRPALYVNIGGGGISASNELGYSIKDAFSQIYVFSPVCALEIRIISYIRLVVGYNFTNVYNVKFDGYSSNDFSNSYISLAIKIVNE